MRGYIHKLVGDEGMAVVEKMIETVPDQEVTDEQVAQLSGINLNLVRKTLYILYENHLAMYRRERDKDSGWLTYLWKLDLDNAEHMLRNEARKLIKKLERRLTSRATSSTSARTNRPTGFCLTMPWRPTSCALWMSPR